ncbi:MAG: hypothetical protein ABIG60_01135 [Patescibacteria group bacterium]
MNPKTAIKILIVIIIIMSLSLTYIYFFYLPKKLDKQAEFINKTKEEMNTKKVFTEEKRGGMINILNENNQENKSAEELLEKKNEMLNILK